MSNAAKTITALRKVVIKAKKGVVKANSGDSDKVAETSENPVEEIKKDPLPNEETVEKTSEIKTETTEAENPVTEVKAEEIKAETIAKPASDGLSFFDDVKEKTEEDTKAEKGKAETIADDLLDPDDLPTADEEMDGEQKKELSKIRAGIYVQVIDLVFMLICMLITGEWSDEGQKKYSLIPQRQKAIKISIYQLLLQSKRKPKPSQDLTWLILGSYAPMIIIALVGLFRKRKEKKKLQEAEATRNAQQMTAEQAAFVKANPTLFTTDQVAAAEAFSPVQKTEEKKKENDNSETFTEKFRKNSASRHAKNCGVHIKKKCNCGAVKKK